MIQAHKLWKKFGRHDAVRDLSFVVPEGSAFALIGANGAGKTTTIKIVMNVLQASVIRTLQSGHRKLGDG